MPTHQHHPTTPGGAAGGLQKRKKPGEWALAAYVTQRRLAFRLEIGLR